jgi:hypothetical protein
LQRIPGVGGVLSAAATPGAAPVLLAMAALTLGLKQLTGAINRTIARGDRALALGLNPVELRRAEAIAGRIGVKTRDVPVEALARRGLQTGRGLGGQLQAELARLEQIRDPRVRAQVARSIGGEGLARMATLQGQRGITGAQIAAAAAGVQERKIDFATGTPFRRQVGQNVSDQFESVPFWLRALGVTGPLTEVIGKGVALGLQNAGGAQADNAGEAFGEAD